MLQDKEREADLHSADPLLHKEVCIETALYLLEHARKIQQNNGRLEDLLKLYRNTFHTHVLLLKREQDAATIRYADYPLSDDLKSSLCKSDGFYTKLANIRFTRTIESPNGELQVLEAQGHPKTASLLAVPLTIKDEAIGALAILSETPRAPTPERTMLLAVAAEILLIIGYPLLK